MWLTLASASLYYAIVSADGYFATIAAMFTLSNTATVLNCTSSLIDLIGE